MGISQGLHSLTFGLAIALQKKFENNEKVEAFLNWNDDLVFGNVGENENHLSIALSGVNVLGGSLVNATQVASISGRMNLPTVDTNNPTQVPEPGMLALLATGGLLGLGFLRRRRPVTASGAASAN